MRAISFSVSGSGGTAIVWVVPENGSVSSILPLGVPSAIA